MKMQKRNKNAQQHNISLFTEIRNVHFNKPIKHLAKITAQYDDVIDVKWWEELKRYAMTPLGSCCPAGCQLLPVHNVNKKTCCVGSVVSVRESAGFCVVLSLEVCLIKYKMYTSKPHAEK